ncbi:MAG TPA: TonB-dependent receptor [Steroidobacteraceae bacterium]
MTGLKFTLGARYSWYDLSNTGGPIVGPLQTTEAKTNAATWTAGLDYQVTLDTLLYLTSRRGFRPGGANGFSGAGTLLNNYGPEYVDDVEVGIKADWKVATIPIRTNIDVYGQRYRDIQVQQIVFANDGSFTALTENAAAARQWGVELEITAQLTDDLQVGATFDYLNFKYTEFAEGVDGSTLEAQKSGNRPPRKYGVNARYHLPVTGQIGEMSVRANWNWQDDSLAVPSGTPINAFGLLNLSAEWNGMLGSAFDSSLFASNVLDKVYSVGGFDELGALGFSIQRFGEPRMYGIRIRYRFGAGR